MATERTVHVVDDDADVLRSLERLLLSAGFTPVLYKSEFALMDAASRLSAGCLLLDVQMPGMDGLELQAQLNDRAVCLPVIVMTGQGDVSAAVRAMKAGAVDFIEKPFDDERLLAALESALAGAGARNGTTSWLRWRSGSSRSAGASGRSSTGSGPATRTR